MGAYRNVLVAANYVAGEWLTSGTEDLPIRDKYTGALLATVPLADAAVMDRAIAAAHAARPQLQALSAAKRAAVLEQMAAAIYDHRDAWADLIVREAGKPLALARIEVERGVATLRLAAGEALRHGGEYVPLDHGAGVGRIAMSRRFPVGVVAGITPFNFPLNLVLHKVAPAIATGCPIIVKPALQAPLSALALALLAEQADYPAAGLQVLLCINEVAERLVTDSRVAMLSFTGSDTVGWRLKALAGKKKVALELGGNAAVIVDETADIATAARAVATGVISYAGQVCISTQRIYVVAAVAEAFRTALLSELAALRSGDPQDLAVVNGPLIDAGHMDRVDRWVADAVAAGARLLAGGHALDAARNVYAPTLLTGTTPAMQVCADEAFGPVAVLEEVADFAAALAAVNDSRFGLQAGVFTARIDRMKAAWAALEVGGIIMNGVPGFRVDSMPYGGVKDSGQGREGLRYAMDEMTEGRLLVM